jgi:hypothetical protein
MGDQVRGARSQLYTGVTNLGDCWNAKASSIQWW